MESLKTRSGHGWRSSVSDLDMAPQNCKNAVSSCDVTRDSASRVVRAQWPPLPVYDSTFARS